MGNFSNSPTAEAFMFRQVEQKHHHFISSLNDAVFQLWLGRFRTLSKAICVSFWQSVLIHSCAGRQTVAPNWGHGCPRTDFLQGYLCTWSVYLFYNLAGLQAPAAEKHLHNMMLPPQCFSVWMDGFGQVMSSAWFLLETSLRIQAREFNPGFSVLFLMAWESFSCFLADL